MAFRELTLNSPLTPQLLILGLSRGQQQPNLNFALATFGCGFIEGLCVLPKCSYLLLKLLVDAGVFRFGQLQTLNLPRQTLNAGLMCMERLDLLTRLSQQPLVVTVQARQVILFQHQGLLELALFHLTLMQLGFMASLILIALFLHGLPVMLQGAPRMNMLLLEGLDLFIPVTDQSLKISTALADPGITRELGLKRRLRGLKVSCLSLNSGLQSVQLPTRRCQLRLQISDLCLKRDAL